MNNITKEKDFEKLFPFWNKITQEDKIEFSNNSYFKSYTKGEIIHGASGECTGGIAVRSGVVRVYILSDDGKEVTLYRLNSGDVCMLSASCVFDSITFDVFVDAQEKTECYIISGSILSKLAKRNLYIENFMLTKVVERFSEVMWVMQQTLFLSFDRRLAIFLYEEMLREDSVIINMTQEEIAKYTVSAREVVSRMLKYFSAEGIAKSIRGGVEVLDREKLKKLALG